MDYPIKKPKNLSVNVPSKLMTKIDYISEKTLLSKGRVVLMSAQGSLETWCKALMDDEVASRTRPASIPFGLPKGPVL